MAFVGGKYLNEDELKAYCEQEALKRDNNRHNSTTKNRHWRRLVAAIRKEVVKQEVRHVLASNDGTDIPLESGVHWKLVKIDLPPKPNYGPFRCVNQAKQPLIQQANDDNEVRLESATKKQRTEKEQEQTSNVQQQEPSTHLQQERSTSHPQQEPSTPHLQQDCEGLQTFESSLDALTAT